MKDWIQILVAFVNDDAGYEFGTTSVREMRVATPRMTIEIQEDAHWEKLLTIGDIFAGKS